MPPNFRVDDPPEPHYAADELGGLCTECGRPIPAALAGQVTMHPACDPDMPALTVAYNRAKAREKLRR